MLGTVITNHNNKEKIDQALQERCNKSMEELHKIKV
jgi:hypothetical protein